VAARITEAQLGLLGFGPDGSRRAAVVPRVDPDRFDFLDLTYRGPIFGKGRPRTSHKDGVFRVHTPPANIKAENSLKACMKLARPPGFLLLDCSLQILIVLRYPIPGSWPKKRQAAALARCIRPSKRPDVDNVLKLIGDAGNKVLWLDDAQIDSVTLERIYVADPEPSIWLRVRRAPLTLPWEQAA
jgi:Holliday junction resolvase RusA-like endonuclease